MSNSDYIFPIDVDPHERKIDIECRDYEVYDEQTLLMRFPDEGERHTFMSRWIARSVIAERSLVWDTLPTNLRAILRRNGWHGFANTPDRTITMNRSIVREYYAVLGNGHFWGKRPYMTHTLRGVPVVLDADWINRYYNLPNVTYEEDYFSHGLTIIGRRVMYDLATAFGGTHLWPPRERRTGALVESIPGLCPTDWVRVMLMFLENRVHGTIHRVQPHLEMYNLVYGALYRRINVGRYILDRISNISSGHHGDGYIHYPYLITALARDYSVPEYDTDDVAVETNPIVYEEHPWFV